MNRNKRNNWLWLMAIVLVSTVLACEKKEDDTPIDMDPDPVAAFTFTVSDFEVTFSNTSTDADSYSWDFGDGNTSTDQNPVHTYASAGDYTVTLTASSSSTQTSDDASENVSIAEPYQSSGYYITSNSFTSASSTVYGGYFAELPSGDIDLTQYESFGALIIRAQHGQYLYGRSKDGVVEGVFKYAIDARTNELVEVASIPTIENASTIVIVDDTHGFYGGGTEMVIYTFNPSTMENTGSIDLSASSPLTETNVNGVASMVYNAETGKLLAPLYSDDPTTGQFYDDDEVHIAVVDVSSESLDKIITHANAEYLLFRGTPNPVIDAAGNTYFIAQGTYGLDFQVGPTAAVGSRPQIVKVDANSDFDESYAWNPINAISLENNLFQLFVSLIYGADGKAYGIGTAGPESVEIQLLLQKLAAGTITNEEYTQLQLLVFNDESLQVIEVDLVSKTATAVSGMPLTAGFGYPYMYNYDGKIYTQMAANGGTFNGFYAIDQSTGIATEQFNITQGGLAFQFIKIGE